MYQIVSMIVFTTKTSTSCTVNTCPGACDCAEPLGSCVAKTDSSEDKALCANAAIRKAVEMCTDEDPTGNCQCTDGCAGFFGPIESWDVSQVTTMNML